MVGLSLVRNQNTTLRLQYSYIIFTIFPLILLFLGLCVSLAQEIHSKIPHATLQVIIIRIISIIFSYSSNTITLLLSAAGNKMNFLHILSNVSHVDLKMFNGCLEINVYIRRWTSIILHVILVTLLLLFETSSACTFYFISRITF
jgi:hypothetical protein